MVLTTFRFDSIGLSEVGHVRAGNEDALFIQKEWGLFLLADGMGGKKGGKIAAELAIESFVCFLKKKIKKSSPSVEFAKSLFLDGYHFSNESVFNEGQTKPDYEGMGTTLCALLLLDHQAIISHVGDSRIYLFRSRRLAQLTEDHTLLNEMLHCSSGEKELPSKHILSRAIGPSPTVTPSLEVCSIDKGDLFLICSDGLSNSLVDREIEDILTQGGGCAEMGNRLMQAALNRGGRDNITLILVQIDRDQS